MSARDAHPELPLDPDTESTLRPLHLRPDALAFVFAGGSVGTLARYGLGEVLPTRAHGWPLGTFVANVAGALVLGVLLEALVRRGSDTGWRRRARLLGGTGFCGGLTTYSSFAVQTHRQAQTSRRTAVAYAVGTLGAALAACALGFALGAGPLE